MESLSLRDVCFGDCELDGEINLSVDPRSGVLAPVFRIRRPGQFWVGLDADVAF